MASKLYALQWSYFRAQGEIKNYQTFLTTFPTNLFQLSFWCEAVIVARLEGFEIPNDAVFYLSDDSYSPLLSKVNEVEQMKLSFKLRLAAYIYNLNTD